MGLTTDQYLAIVLGVIGIIEGLALAKLAEAVSERAAKGQSELIMALPNLLLCFLTILRVFQGFVAVGIRPITRVDYQVQLVIAFVLGVLQYCMTDAVKEAPYGRRVYGTAVLLAIVGCVSHMLNYFNMENGEQGHLLVSGADMDYDFQVLSLVLLGLSAVLLSLKFRTQSDKALKNISWGASILLSINIIASYLLTKYGPHVSAG